MVRCHLKCLSDWPIISFIVDVPEYRAIYDAYIKEFIEGAFLPSKMSGQYAGYDMLISSSATSELADYTFLTGTGSYTSAVSTITSHCGSRSIAANSYLK